MAIIKKNIHNCIKQSQKNRYISSKKVKAETVFVSGKECLTA